MVARQRVVADTSIFIGLEARRFDDALISGIEFGVSVVTLGELRLGVMSVTDPEILSRRLATYELARQFEPLPVDEAVSESWALLVAKLRAAGRKAPINDTWIAATALSRGLAVATQDNDYDAMPGLSLIKI